jgi:hypothetical protein
MTKLARWQMHEAAHQGFRAIRIECFHDAVNHVWTNPPEPYQATVVSSLNVKGMEEERDGKVVKPYLHLDQLATKVFVTLR